MEKVGQFTYQKLNYQKYYQTLNNLLHDERLNALKITKQTLGTTTYGYPVDCITIGTGSKEIFLVGGTHGSETISVDFILNFLKELPNLNGFNPNDFKLIIIPLQNPEGFDISTNTFSNIPDETFEKKSHEYYLRYRTDSIIIYAISELNKAMKKINDDKAFVTPKHYLSELILFTKTNASWKNLSDDRAVPGIKRFNSSLEQITEVKDYHDLRAKLLFICDKYLSQIDLKDLNDVFYYLLLLEIKNSFSSDQMWEEISNSKQQKLYQQMFEKAPFAGTKSDTMSRDVEAMYQENNHPLGSQIGHDSTGLGINLNANHSLSPGILSMQEKIDIYGPFVKNNIKNYTRGPLGVPTVDPNNFEYSIENKILEKLLRESYQRGNYLFTILYHGTGGQIFYKPFSELMTKDKYQDYLRFNEILANNYSEKTGYKLLSSSSSTGYGDFLRRTYPGVLLVELSKMGGNPIGPYGDKNNVYNTFHDNTQALNNLFIYMSKNMREKNKSKSLK